MRSSIVLSALFALTLASAQTTTTPVTGKLGDAPIAYGNPAAVYVATLPDNPANTVRGTITATTASNGTGVVFNVQVHGLPSSGGPFLYHIHQKPVPANGSCAATLAHLDPYQRGETPPCDPNQPEKCQVGDLGGKHGQITGDPFLVQYTDLYTSTSPSNPAFFGNLSVVVHYNNKTRITCANFVQQSGSSNGTYTTTTNATPTGPSVSATASAYVNAASGTFFSLSALLGGLLVGLL